MSKGKDDIQPRGIYHRLITSIIDHLIALGQKNVTLGSKAAMSTEESIEVPVIGSSKNMKIMPSKTSIDGNGGLNNEVVVDFRHIEEKPTASAEVSTSFRKLSSQANLPNQNGFIVRAVDQNQIPVVNQGKERGGRRRQQQQQQSADPIKEGEREDHSREKYYNQKQRDILTDPPSSTGNEIEDAKWKHVSRSRPSRPPLTSVFNINEKADAFIRSRKEAMKKNFGHGS